MMFNKMTKINKHNHICLFYINYATSINEKVYLEK